MNPGCRQIVRVGQIWASNDSRDVRAGHNQARACVGVTSTHALLTSQNPRGHVMRFRVKLTPMGPNRHRLVQDVD